MVEELSPGDLRVWYRFTEALSSPDVAALESTLSAEERERCARFVYWRDRRDFVAAHALVRQTLSRYGHLSPEAWQFTTTKQGKPNIEGQQSSGLGFSVSHTRGLVACAAAVSADVGVDVEQITESAVRRELVTEYFSVAERRFLATVPLPQHARRFTELWTLKESYLKSLGFGLLHPMDAFGFSFGADRGISFDGPTDPGPGHWYFALAEPAPTYRLAVAVRWTRPCAHCRVIVRDVDGSDAKPLQIARESTRSRGA